MQISWTWRKRATYKYIVFKQIQIFQDPQDVLPDWIRTVDVSMGVFIKVDKSIDLKTIMKKLEKAKIALSVQ